MKANLPNNFHMIPDHEFPWYLGIYFPTFHGNQNYLGDFLRHYVEQLQKETINFLEYKILRSFKRQRVFYVRLDSGIPILGASN